MQMHVCKVTSARVVGLKIFFGQIQSNLVEADLKQRIWKIFTEGNEENKGGREKDDDVQPHIFVFFVCFCEIFIGSLLFW